MFKKAVYGRTKWGFLGRAGPGMALNGQPQRPGRPCNNSPLPVNLGMCFFFGQLYATSLYLKDHDLPINFKNQGSELFSIVNHRCSSSATLTLLLKKIWTSCLRIPINQSLTINFLTLNMVNHHLQDTILSVTILGGGS